MPRILKHNLIPGLRLRKTIPIGRRTRVNVSGTGVSVSERLTDRITVNTDRGATFHLGKGASYQLTPRQAEKGVAILLQMLGGK